MCGYPLQGECLAVGETLQVLDNLVIVGHSYGAGAVQAYSRRKLPSYNALRPKRS